MDKVTHVITLPSGVECEHTELTGKEQRLLTEQKGKKMGEQLNDVILSIVKRLGDNHSITEQTIKDLLSEDRKAILWNARRVSVDGDKFQFKWDYVDTQKKQQKKDMEVDLVDESFGWKPYKQQVTDYSQLEKKVELTLKKTGKLVRFSLLDGNGEVIGAATKKDERSSHTAILMRNPVEFMKGATETIPVRLNLDNLPLTDIEQLREAIKEHEGKVPTEIRFEHPDIEHKPQHEKYVVVDLLSQLAFFFPSEAI
jgi:hypothetical protein